MYMLIIIPAMTFYPIHIERLYDTILNGLLHMRILTQCIDRLINVVLCDHLLCKSLTFWVIMVKFAVLLFACALRRLALACTHCCLLEHPQLKNVERRSTNLVLLSNRECRIRFCQMFSHEIDPWVTVVFCPLYPFGPYYLFYVSANMRCSYCHMRH